MLITQLYLILCDPMDYSPPGSNVHGIIQARILEWVAIPFTRDLPDSGIEPRSLASQIDSLPSEPPRQIFKEEVFFSPCGMMPNMKVSTF